MNVSYSAMNTLKDCPRCFWLDRKMKITRPQGIKSGMPTAVDGILKDGLDAYRGKLPPILAAESALKDFVLYDSPEMKKMRHWNSNPLNFMLPDGTQFISAFDDLLHSPKLSKFMYLDYKTTGKEPDQAFGEKYYQGQADLYTHAIKVNGRAVADIGVLLFFWPEPDGKGGVVFKSKVIILKVDPDRCPALFKEVAKVLALPSAPIASPTCEYCSHIAKAGAVK